jgi:hypothetical protein
MLKFGKHGINYIFERFNYKRVLYNKDPYVFEDQAIYIFD